MSEPTTKSGRKQKTLRIAGYVRVSRQGEREDDRFRSPAFQRETIERFAALEGYELRMFEPEIDVSGAKAKRPTLETILAAIEAGELDGVAVAKLDRLSRLAPKARLELFERVEQAGGVVLSASESNDVSTPEGRFVRELFLALARMEWEKKADGFAVAKANAVANGISVGRTPFGLRVENGRRVVDAAAAAIVVELFELRAGGASYGDVLACFEERTGRRSSRQTIADLLANRAYLGELRHGELFLEDAHPAIVPLELFEAVQAVTAARRGPKRVGNGKARTLLAGIAECAGCGAGLGRSANASGVVYKCPNDARHCSARASIYEDVLDSHVVEQVLEWAGPVADELVEVELEHATGDRVEVERRLEQARGALIGWASDVAAELDDPAAYKAGLQAREALVAKRERELVELGEQTELELARGTVRGALVGEDALELAERRHLLAVVLERVVVRKTPRVGAPAAERAQLLFAVPASAQV